MKAVKSTRQTKKLLMELVSSEADLHRQNRFLHKLIGVSRQYDFVRRRLELLLGKNEINLLRGATFTAN